MRSLTARLTLGALAGFCATLPMTVAMNRLHRHLPLCQRYPLPPREITESLPKMSLGASAATVLHHFLFGAAGGALFAALTRRRDLARGSAFGVIVWLTSYLGWIPAAGLLRPATDHHGLRNALMIAVHLVWGSVLSLALLELEAAAAESFASSAGPQGELKDTAPQVAAAAS